MQRRVALGDRLAFVGLVQARIGFDDPPFHRREITLLANRNSCNDFPRIIRLIEADRIDTTPWITHRLGLTSVPDQFAALSAQPCLVKAMIEASDVDAVNVSWR
jgi:threonine dehydrogenase-like Zn-dependent dehydrogenase